MRIQEIIRDYEGPEDGRFISKDRKGEPGTETEHNVVLTPEEKAILMGVDEMGKAETVCSLNTHFSNLVQSLTEYRGQIVRRLTEKHLRKPGG